MPASAGSAPPNSKRKWTGSTSTGASGRAGSTASGLRRSAENRPRITHDLRFQRVIDAPSEEVFDAFTRPDGQRAFHGRGDPGWIVQGKSKGPAGAGPFENTSTRRDAYLGSARMFIEMSVFISVRIACVASHGACWALASSATTLPSLSSTSR